MLSAPVVQWIERQPPKLEMWVRLPPGANLKASLLRGFLLKPEAGKLLCLCREAKAGAMFLFEGKPYCSARKAKTARPGPKDFYVSKNTVGDSRQAQT